MKKSATYGSWQSPISAEMIAGATVGLEQPALADDSSYWIEKRPAEKGRQVLVRCDTSGNKHDLIPPPFSARSRVHEYGGGVYTVDGKDIYFVNDSDQGVYVSRAGALPVPVLVADKLRFADCCVDPVHHRLICVCEDHGASGEPQNRLVSISLRGQPIMQVLHQGYDFYAAPAIDREGKYLAWLAWRHPNMPWDGTELMLAGIHANGTMDKTKTVAGGDSESVFQPRWSPDGRLYFVSDRNGWWNLYRLQTGAPTPVCEFDAEFAMPMWMLGMSTYAFRSADEIVCCYCQQGQWSLGLICTRTGELQRIDTPYTDLAGIQANAERVIFIAGAPARSSQITQYRLTDNKFAILKRSADHGIGGKDIAIGESVSYPTSNGETAHAFFYAPANSRYSGPKGRRPPVIVISHGGPTAASGNSLNYKIQYWTSRGFAVLDVNYRGSSGYGRAYRRALNGHWGVYDVADCEYGVRYLADRGDVDPDQAIIRGSSAGGYTTLCALTFGTVFKAGASLYGIGDLETLIRDTHKFEARYLDRLIGPYPRERARYQSRSPIHATERLNCPVIFLQGLEDRVVPPSQAETMVAALDRKGIAVAYVAFPGEQHGFRQATSIRRALEAELGFYSRIFDLRTPDKLESIVIRNLDI